MLARVHSLLGVVPLAAYLCLHLYDNWPALEGREPWVDRALHAPSRPWVLLLVLLPMLVHAALGMQRFLREASSETGPRGGRASSRLQAITGLLVLGFVVFHVSQMWTASQGPQHSPYDAYAVLWSTLGRPPVLGLYLLGVSAVCFHLAHGLPRAALTFAPALPERAVLLVRVASGVLGALLWLMLLQLLAHFALGHGLV
jgi:succinate dehydrogenase / fumarate reductase, cytochrome b subunit